MGMDLMLTLPAILIPICLSWFSCNRDFERRFTQSSFTYTIYLYFENGIVWTPSKSLPTFGVHQPDRVK